jgi:hypothetical protein
VFAGPQDQEVYPNQGEVSDDDARYLAFIASTLPPALDQSDIAAAQRDALLAFAAIRIAPLQDAIDLDEATAEEIAGLKEWKQYRIALNRLDLTTNIVDWPLAPK